MSCRAIQILLLVIIAIFSLFGPFVGWMVSKWVIFIAAIILIVHVTSCKKCSCKEPIVKKKSRKR